MEFRDKQAIYLQIAEYVCEQILLNKWPLGEKFLSIRDMAVAMEVNPNTVQRAYDFLQQREIVTNKRGIGYFVKEGGNLTNITFEPSKKSSVRVFKMWEGLENKAVKATVKNDTLFLKFPKNITGPNEKRYMSWNTLVRIFSPELLSVNGHDTN